MGVVAVAGLAISAYSAYSQHEAGKRVENAQRARAEQERLLSEEAKQERLEERARWDRMFGPMERNIADFYSNLDKSYVIAEGNEALAESYSISKNSLIDQLRMNGLDLDDGVGAAMLAQTATSHADARAKLYATAESTVIGMQQNAMQAAGPRPGAGAQQDLNNRMNINRSLAQADEMSLRRQQTDTNNLLDLARGAGSVYGEYQSKQTAHPYTPTVGQRLVSNPSIYYQINEADGYMF